jgi:hypothetical protein
MRTWQWIIVLLASGIFQTTIGVVLGRHIGQRARLANLEKRIDDLTLELAEEIKRQHLWERYFPRGGSASSADWSDYYDGAFTSDNSPPTLTWGYTVDNSGAVYGVGVSPNQESSYFEEIMRRIQGKD